MTSQSDDEIHRSRRLLQNPYAYLDEAGRYDAVLHRREVDVHDARRSLQNQYAYLDEHGGYGEWPGVATKRTPRAILIDPARLLGGRKRGSKFTNADLEGIARRLQVELWEHRRDFWPARARVGPVEVLDPIVALQAIGYSVSLPYSLGQQSGRSEVFEVAGVIDRTNSRAQISGRFSPEIRHFTAAHELAHAILHEGAGLHRDKALDGTAQASPRDPTEREADVFAAYFLLPGKQVRSAFERRFGTRQFVPDDANALELRFSNLDVLRSECRTLRDLARVLASAMYYHELIEPLAEQFRVSTEAMAIRLEELELLKMSGVAR